MPVYLPHRLRKTVSALKELIAILDEKVSASAHITDPTEEGEAALPYLKQIATLANRDVRLCKKRGKQRKYRSAKKTVSADDFPDVAGEKLSLREQARRCYIRNRHLSSPEIRPLIMQKTGCNASVASLLEDYFRRRMEDAPAAL